MKVTILKEKLRQGLSIVEKITGRNLTLPILNNVLISTEGNFLKLSTTDLETGINYWVLSKTEKEGKITVPAKFLSNFISTLPDSQLILESKNENLYVSGENNKTLIKGQNPDDFPVIPSLNNEFSLEIKSTPFCRGVSQVIDFCTQNQIRPEISGVYFNFQKKGADIVSTDSFRLAEKKLFYEKEIEKNFSLILPQKTVRELINIFSGKGEKIKIYFSPNQILFESLIPEVSSHPRIQIISRLIEGEYPNYYEIIPKTYETQIILPKNDFLNQVKVASFFSGKTNEIKIKTIPKKGIEMFSQSQETGENKSFLPAKIQGKEAEASFNHRFIIDGLLNINSSEVIFELNGENGPAVLKPVGDESYVYIVMPIKSD